MNFVFTVVYSVLRWMSDVTGLSYNEINIIVFYFCIPAIFLFLIDRIIKRPVFAPSFIILSALFFVFIPSFREFSDRLFALSVNFLLWFSVIGWSYTVASVVMCSHPDFDLYSNCSLCVSSVLSSMFSNDIEIP